MKQYIVVIQNSITKEFISTICKDNDELATLISHLNTNQYNIDSIKGVENVIESIDHFCVKETNLETGDNPKEAVK